jgi:hypothetical protein
MEIAKVAILFAVGILGGAFAWWACKINCEEKEARKRESEERERRRLADR